MSYHNTPIPIARSTTNAQGQTAPIGYHYMPDGSLMLDSSHVGYQEEKVITSFDLDLSDLPASSSVRYFTFIGDEEADFILEIKNENNYYYNFVTSSFQAGQARLEESIVNGNYKGSITFPTVTNNDQYNILIYAKPGTKHGYYNEVRFGDGSLDVNSSTGSNSLMMQKVVYQYTALTLTINGYSPNNTVAATLTPDTFSTSRGKSLNKTAFSFVATAAATAAYRVLRQPVSSDIISFLEPVVGTTPITIVGENEYPEVTVTGKINGAVSNNTNVTINNLSATPKVGDKFVVVGGANSLLPQIVTAVGGESVTSSVAISAANDAVIQFSNQMNFSWPINNFAHLLQEGMIVMPDPGFVTTDTTIGSYGNSITILPGTKEEKTITKNKKQGLSSSSKPTIVKGLVTVQEGQIVFDKQQVLTLAGRTLKVGGYGVGEVRRLHGWEIKLTDLAVALTTPTTTTTDATTAHATIEVADKEGIINNVSRVGGIGINPALQNPLITSGGGADGPGDWVMDAVQTLESGITLTVENTSRVATITGNIEVVKVGTANQTIRFDLEKILSTSAPS